MHAMNDIFLPFVPLRDFLCYFIIHKLSENNEDVVTHIYYIFYIFQHSSY